MPDRFAIANGRVVLESEASVPAASPAILFGAGVFDTLKCGPGRLYWLPEHVERFRGFCRELEIPPGRSAGEIEEDVKRCLAANPWGPVALKILATLRSATSADLFVVVAERLAYPEALYREGTVLAVSGHRQNERGSLAGKKTLNYFERYLARKEALRRGILDWLYLDTRGNVSEGTFLNVFWVKGDRVYTPELSTGILSGITRTVVQKILADRKIRVEEGAYPLEALLGADEAFLTSSVLEVAPLARVDGRKIGPGTPGALTRDLMTWYRAERDARGTTSI